MHTHFRLAGVMGWPIAHSRSPKIHNHWLAQHGLEGCYVPLAVAPDKLGAALRALVPLGFAGCNLTIPHKEKALALVDRVEPFAQRIGAINCVVVEADGSLTGKNYDAFGFISSLKASAPRWRAEDAPAAVIGAGGGARAVVAGLVDAGVPEVRVFNRTLARAQALAQDLGPPVKACPWEERHAGLQGAGLVVNTTSLGMIGQLPLDLDLSSLPSGAIVADIVYAPLETPMLAAARRVGLVTVDGLGMLLHQARPAFRDWFGVMPEATPALRNLIAATIE
ncbi:MAG TPA: shikimate dehydrogenase [Methylocystis sp.]|nr:shikimate dehydrogenase [Methylocystis sp.]